MPKIRSIKPETARSHTLSRLPESTVLMFVLLWDYCDDYGNRDADPVLIKCDLYPLRAEITPETIMDRMDALEAAGLIQRIQSRREALDARQELGRASAHRAQISEQNTVITWVYIA